MRGESAGFALRLIYFFVLSEGSHTMCTLCRCLAACCSFEASCDRARHGQHRSVLILHHLRWWQCRLLLCRSFRAWRPPLPPLNRLPCLQPLPGAFPAISTCRELSLLPLMLLRRAKLTLFGTRLQTLAHIFLWPVEMHRLCLPHFQRALQGTYAKSLTVRTLEAVNVISC